MNQLSATGDSPAASLVGSVSAFHLTDVLSLLAHTGQTGELQVVGAGVDGRVWLEEGELTGSAVGSSLTVSQAVFELGLLSDGWFSFTEDLRAPAPAPGQTVASVLSVVGPQVEEWHELLGRVPLDAVVRLSPEPPSAEVQIRADQWQILTTVGKADLSVQDVVAALDHDQVVTLRLLRDLLDAGLISVDRGEAEVEVEVADEAAASEPSATVGLSSWPPPLSTPNSSIPPSSEAAPAPSEIQVMPPPISADPWSVAPAPVGEAGVASGESTLS
ncbi:MAG TPA: DUF4388 domain-containing protein [Acidimicrobiales bacterium]|nr:DUF4388 domain-containing protein [Acidimicrobiales bacterium]